MEILKEQLGFILALVIGVIAHTIAGAIKHKSDFDWKKLLSGAFDFTMILLVILMVVVGTKLYEPLAQFEQEIETLKEVIVIGVYAKVIMLIKDYWNIKDEDVKNFISENEGRG